MSMRLPGQIPRFPPTADRWLRRVTFGALALLALILLTHKVFNSDVWWHLKTGERILAGYGIPQTDPYTYTVLGHEWIDLHWGFQVLIALLFRVAGPLGLNIYLYLSVGIALVLTARNQYDRQYWSLTAVFMLLLLLVANPRFLVRPEGLTFICLAGVVWRVLRLREPGADRWLWIVPPILVVWANTQGLFILGIVLLLLVGTGDVLRRTLPIPLGWGPEPLLPAQARRLWMVTGASVAAALVTPYGIRGLLFPLTLFTRVGGSENVFSQVIAEFQPPFSGPWSAPTQTFLLFIVLALPILMANVRRLPLGAILSVFAFFFLALSARRNVPVALFVLVPLTVQSATSLLRRAERVVLWDLVGVCTWAQAGLGIIVTLIALGHLPYLMSDRYYVADRRGEQFGLGIATNIYPGPAFDFLEQHDLPPNLMNSMYIGGYAIYRLAPERLLVSLDSRLEVHTADTVGAYVTAARGRTELQGLLNLYEAQTAVIAHNAQDVGDLMTSFLQLPDWVMVHLDACGAVFVRTQVARRYRLPRVVVPLPPEAAAIPVTAGLDSTIPAWTRPIMAAVDRLHWGPTFPGQRFHLGTLYLELGGAAAAIPLFEEGLAQYPYTAVGWYNLGKAFERTSRFTEAQAAYEEAVVLDPNLASGWVSLGLLRADVGDGLGARRAYERAVQADTHSASARYNLARALTQAGDFQRAHHHLRRLTLTMPDTSRWWYELGRTCRRTGRFREGIDALERAVVLEPARVRYWVELSDLLYADGQEEAGTAALRAAFELAPDAPEVRERIRAMGSGVAP